MSTKGITTGTEPRDRDDVRTEKHDAALDYLEAHQEASNGTSIHDEHFMKRLRRKVDLMVMPFLLLCYSMNFLDKVLLNYAQVMGLTPALALTGNDFSNAASAFWIAVVVATVPNIFLLQRLPTAKWLGTTLTLWGICTACHAALRNYTGLLAVRVFCGIFESAVPSALMLLSSQYYTRSEQAIRFSYWYCGLGIGQMFGGLFSFAFQHVTAPPSSSTAGWRMMFLALGLFTILLGVSIIVLVPDIPWNARFFTTEEKVALLMHVKGNQTGIKSQDFQARQLLEGLVDPQIWMMFAIILLQGVGGGTITTYSATLLLSFGYTSMQSALLNMPSGAINIASTLFCGFMARFFGLRWIWTGIVSLLGIMGAALMSFISTTNQPASLAGIYLANFIVGAAPVDYQWLIGNTAGTTKRAFTAAMLNAAFGVGNIIGPQTYRARDAPLYKPAKISLVACWSASVLLTVLMASYYYLVNRQRDSKYGKPIPEDEISDAKAFAGQTDKENKNFRYRY